MLRIGVIGDFDPANETHLATTNALGHAAASLGHEIDVEWIATDAADLTDRLRDFVALVIAPGSPYRSQTGALDAIEHARTNRLPLLATCGGFQHVVLEWARNVLGFADAEHAEYDPYASRLFITPLSCSLAGQVMDVEIKLNTAASWAYQATGATERYYCNFGLNPDHLDELLGSGLTLSGVDADGEPRILELTGHAFFVATLFVPQASSSEDHPHPLVVALLRVASSSLG